MIENRILFEKFELPIIKGLKYLKNEESSNNDYLFVNEPNDNFSIYFEKGFPLFSVPEKTERNYCLLELKRKDKIIKFFCPEKQNNLDNAVWYFYLEFSDKMGNKHLLPGQVRVVFDGQNIRQSKGKPSFIDVLDQVKLCEVHTSC